MTVYPDEGLPTAVTIYEVGPRDGLQNEPGLVPVETKVELVNRLQGAGLQAIEVTSLVRPDRVRQLADAEELWSRLGPLAGKRRPVLVPNRRGLERALALGVGEIAVFASATETFARRNLNASRARSMAEIAAVVAEALAAGVVVRGYVSMCFGDPWEGAVEPDGAARITGELLDLGCHEVSLGDTIGVATPGHVLAVLGATVAAGARIDQLAVHFHDTYGQALANVGAALRFGVTTLDSSAGGLGGCPFADSATGNLATEDLVFQLDGLGIATGVDLESLVATSVWMAGELGRPSPSRTVQALARARI